MVLGLPGYMYVLILFFNISDNSIYVIMQFEFFGWCHYEHYQMLLPMSTGKKWSFSWLIFKEKLVREVVHPMVCKNLIHAFVFNTVQSSDINSSGRMTSICAIWSPIQFLVLEICSDGTGKLYLGKLLLNVTRMCIYDCVCVVFVYT